MKKLYSPNLYKFNDNERCLEVYGNMGIQAFCDDNDVDLKKFDYLVVINDFVSDCSYMFYNCEAFNQPVQIPSSVTDCSHMFEGCKSLQQPIQIPESVVSRDMMFYKCPNMNKDGTPISVSGKMSSFDVYLYLLNSIYGTRLSQTELLSLADKIAKENVQTAADIMEVANKYINYILERNK